MQGNKQGSFVQIPLNTWPAPVVYSFGRMGAVWFVASIIGHVQSLLTMLVKTDKEQNKSSLMIC